MYSKNIKGFVGYGNSVYEACNACYICCILNNFAFINDVEDLLNMRRSLLPWQPKDDTFYSIKSEYVKVQNKNNINYLNVRGRLTIINEFIYSTLYRAFNKYMSFIEVCLCIYEIKEMLLLNGIPKYNNKYYTVVPESIDFNDYDIQSLIVSDKFSIIFYCSNKVSVRENKEDIFWSCTFEDREDIVDVLYYIAYSRGYSDFDLIFR